MAICERAFPGVCRLVYGVVAACLVAQPVRAETLNKCIDAQGHVTYANTPCTNAREVQRIEIDPAPVAKPAPRSPPVRSAAPETAAGRVEMHTFTSPKPQAHPKSHDKTCRQLADKLGRVLDAMDEAHRKGYTQNKMEKWKQQVKELERKKEEAGCF